MTFEEYCEDSDYSHFEVSLLNGENGETILKKVIDRKYID